MTPGGERIPPGEPHFGMPPTPNWFLKVGDRDRIWDAKAAGLASTPRPPPEDRNGPRAPFFCLNDMQDLIAKTAAEKRLAGIASSVVEGMGFELIRVRLMSGSGTRLQIMADRRDGGIDIDDCASISAALSAVLDVEDPLSGNYVLEVSSPGINRPLTRVADFEDWRDHSAKLETSVAIDGRKRFKGTLLGIEGDEILIEIEEGTIGIRLDWLVSARLAPAGEQVLASLKPRKQTKQSR